MRLVPPRPSPRSQCLNLWHVANFAYHALVHHSQVQFLAASIPWLPALPQLSPLSWLHPPLWSRCSAFPSPCYQLTSPDIQPPACIFDLAHRSSKFERLKSYLLVTNMPSYVLGHRPRRNSWLIGEVRLTSPYQFNGSWYWVLKK